VRPRLATDRDGRLLAYVHDCGRPVDLAIETKHPTRFAGLVERRLVQTLDRYGWAHPRLGAQLPVRVMSFSWLSLRRMRSLAPSIPSVFLMERVPLRMFDGTLPGHVGIAGPSIDVVRAHPKYVQRVHRRGGAVHVWVVDDPADVQLCLGLGVDAIITNRPAEVLATVTAYADGASP
jgi:glycerophosphoryl diester phosphodiesterase